MISIFLPLRTNIPSKTFHQIVFMICQNCWTVKCRSHWSTYTMRSVLVYNGTSISGKTFIHQIVFKICQNCWTVKCRLPWSTYTLEISFRVTWNQCPNYDVHPSNSLQVQGKYWTMKYWWQLPIWYVSNFGATWKQYLKNNIHSSKSLKDIRQNCWTVKYRSHWCTYTIMLNLVQYKTKITSMLFIHQVQKIQGKITGSWNIRSHWPTYDMNSILVIPYLSIKQSFS